MEHKTNMIPEEELEIVSGGTGTRPAPRYAEGDYVKLSTDPVIVRIQDNYYDKDQKQWMYWAEHGFFHETHWFSVGLSFRVAEDQLTPVGNTKSEFVTTLPDKTVIKTFIVE